jgi:hypothetical protein
MVPWVTCARSAGNARRVPTPVPTSELTAFACEGFRPCPQRSTTAAARPRSFSAPSSLGCSGGGIVLLVATLVH